MKNLRHLFEYILLRSFFTVFRIMPYKFASFYGGIIAQSLGPFFKAHKTAKKNLKLTFPERSDQEIERIARAVWNNLGRNIAEFPHLTSGKTVLDKITLEGKNNISKYIKNIGKKPVLFVTAHYSNWELTNQTVSELGFTLNSIYRPANNEMVDDYVVKKRINKRSIIMHKKGVSGSRGFLKHLIKNEAGGMLIDQKFSEGITHKFLGRDAMSSTLIATLAKKYEIDIVPCHVERNGSDLKMIFNKPILYKNIKDLSDEEILTQINQVIEGWILEKPEEWFWVHNRWK
jgi:KDO2-lipid IV(A) lauroyltransferase